MVRFTGHRKRRLKKLRCGSLSNQGNKGSQLNRLPLWLLTTWMNTSEQPLKTNCLCKTHHYTYNTRVLYFLSKMPDRDSEHLTPATRLLEKRREMAEVEQALVTQKEVKRCQFKFYI